MFIFSLDIASYKFHLTENIDMDVLLFLLFKSINNLYKPAKFKTEVIKKISDKSNVKSLHAISN